MFTFKNWRCATQKLAVLALLTVAQCAIATEAKMALRGGPCVKEYGVWSDVEEWVWDRLCIGEIADLNQRDRPGLVATSEEGWGAERVLSPEFLESVLLHEPWVSAVPREGVRIVGAYFLAPVDLDHSHIEHQLWLDRSRFAAFVTFHEGARWTLPAPGATLELVACP